jgi:transcription elongation factor SPT5
VHEGETGLVLKVVDDKVTLLGDLSMEELRVFVRDLQLTTEVSAGVDSLGLYVLHDLVQIKYVASHT